VVQADDSACVAITKSQVDVQGGRMECLTGQDLTEYDYISVSKDGFVPIIVKPMMSETRLSIHIV
jgi:hypothetical protein